MASPIDKDVSCSNRGSIDVQSSYRDHKVSFSSDVRVLEEEATHSGNVSDSSSEDESFHEITTSEGESYCTSDDEDEIRLYMLMEGSYAYSPKKTFAKDAVERNSLLLLDKDLQYEVDYIESYDSSALSEASSSGCGNGCGTSEESSGDDLSPKKKRKVDVSNDNDDTNNPRLLQLRHSKRASKGKSSSQEKRQRGTQKKKKATASKPGTQDNGVQNIRWKLDTVKTSVRKETCTPLPTFQSSPTGPLPRTKECKTPLQILQLFLTTVILESVVKQTQLFAEQKGVDFPFCVEELMAFLGINIGMGLLRLPQIRDYWSKSKILSTPFFPSIMSRDRFQTILRYLHLNDSSLQKKSGEEGYDRLYKVRPLLDHLAGVYPLYYQADQHVSVDEMMIGTRCKVSFLQYMPKKPTKFGIKVWVLAEAKTGYVLSLQVYTGAENGPEKDLGKKVVMNLMHSYQGKNHLLYIDSFYTSPALLIDLLAKGVYCTGTVRSNRKGFPSALVPLGSKAKIGSYRFATATKHQLTAAWWKDRRDVFVMSTLHGKAVQTTMKRPKGEKEKQKTPCPAMILDYNQNMGGVDLADQHLSYYSLGTRRTLKWWKKVFWRLVDISIVNSWIIYKTNFPSSKIKSQKLFREKLVEELVQPLLTLRSTPTCPEYLQLFRRTPTTETRLLGKHFPFKSKERQRCVVCSEKPSPVTGKRLNKRTQNFCPKCKVHLCFGKCFESYHTLTNY